MRWTAIEGHVLRSVKSKNRALTAAYTRDGVSVLRSLFSVGEVRQIRESIERYAALVPMLPPSLVLYEPGGTAVRNFLRMDAVDTYFRELAEQRRLKDLVRSIAGFEPRVFFVDSFNKTARKGSKVEMHQDAAYIRLKPTNWATFWIAIDRATARNGAVRYYLGSHRWNLLPHSATGSGEDRLAIVDQEDVRRQAAGVYVAELEPGDAVLHDSFIAHESDANTGTRGRFGLTIGYRTVDSVIL